MKDLPCRARPHTATTPTGPRVALSTASACAPSSNLPVAASYLISSSGVPCGRGREAYNVGRHAAGWAAELQLRRCWGGSHCSPQPLHMERQCTQQTHLLRWPCPAELPGGGLRRGCLLRRGSTPTPPEEGHDATAACCWRTLVGFSCPTA